MVARGAAALCVAGMALAHIHLRFAWQAWDLRASTFFLRGRCGTYDTGLDLVGRLGAGGRPWRRGTLRGRRGTCSHPPSFCVAGVALSRIHLRFARQDTGLDLVVRLGAVSRPWRRGTLRGRHGTCSHPPSV